MGEGGRSPGAVGRPCTWRPWRLQGLRKERSEMSKRLPYMRALSCTAVALLLVTGTTAAGLRSVQAAGPACGVQYTVNSDWGTGFSTAVTITNNGPAINGWVLQFVFPGSQQVTFGWSGTWSQSGNVVTVHDAGWNGQLATNQSTSIGFNGSGSGSPKPAVFTLNGQSCNHPAPMVAITAPAPGASFTAPANITLAATAAAATGSTITQVAYLVGTTVIGTATASPYSVTWQNVAGGDYNVTAVATDSTGATGTSPPFGIHVAASPSVVFNATTLSVQIGGTATFAVSLSSAPSASVMVTVARTGGDADVSVQGSGSLTFTPATFSHPQTR